MAGIIDGEGHIGIYKRHSPNPNFPTKYYPVIRVEMSDRIPAELISNEFGGKIYSYKPKDNHKTTFIHETVHQDRLTKLVNSIYPHLRVKKKQAEIVLDALRLKAQYPRRVLNDHKAIEITQNLHSMFLKIRELNHASAPYQ